MGHLAEMVKARRELLGLSQMALGEKINLRDGKSYFSRIENGLVIPSRSRLSELETALGFAAGELQSAALSDELTRQPA